MLNKYVGELIWIVSMTINGNLSMTLFSNKKHYFYVSRATCSTFFRSSFYNESLT